MIVSWFSGGATSAIACKLTIEASAEPVRLVYIETGSHHSDAPRFHRDCENWFGKEIETIRNPRYTSVFDVLRKERFLNGPQGAKCTAVLKRIVRTRWQEENNPNAHVWGFHFEPNELKRRDRLVSLNPGRHLFPLIEKEITKPMALRMLLDAGIELPAMYLLGYSNANCIGCVKGGAGYWNKIRVDFPEVFAEMARLEREIGRSCQRRHFLDELHPDAGRHEPPLVADCGSVGEGCEVANSLWFYTRE